MMDTIRSVGTRSAAIACAALFALSTVTAAQTVVPRTACDAALANPDMHPQPEMPLENGALAFSYNAQGPFVTGGGSLISINVALLFQPGPDATITLTAVDEGCAGSGRAGTVFRVIFNELTSTRNSITYDAVAGELSFNGKLQDTKAQGTPRYFVLDVWDGELPSTHATHSYLIDLQNPANPTQ